MRILGAIVLMAAAQPLFACEVRVVENPRTLVRRAAIVVEGIATSDRHTFEVTKVWKGKAPAQIRLTGLKVSASPGSCDDFPPVVGERHLVLINSTASTAEEGVTVLSGKARAFHIDAAKSILAYLAGPVTVYRETLLKMLRDWHKGRITDRQMAAWLKEITPVAEVSDWATHPGDSEESSLVLNILHELDRSMNDRGVPVEELSCELGVLRTRVAPVFIRMLSSTVTVEELEKMEDPDDLVRRLCPGS